MEFGEVRSWCALGEKAFLRRFPAMLVLLKKLHDKNPERYFAEVAPYVKSNWKGLYHIRQSHEWDIIDRYAPFGKYKSVISRELPLPDISYEGLEELTIYDEYAIEDFGDVYHPRMLDIHLYNTMPDIRPLLKRVERLKLEQNSSDVLLRLPLRSASWEDLLQEIVKIPEVSLDFNPIDSDFANLFSSTVWQSHTLSYTKHAPLLDVLSEGLIVQPHIKTLRVPLGLTEDVDLSCIRAFFPALDTLLFNRGNPFSGKIILPGGYWKEVGKVNGYISKHIIFHDTVIIGSCSYGGMRSFQGDNIKVQTFDLRGFSSASILKDFTPEIMKYDVEHLYLSSLEGLKETPIPSCVKRLTLSSYIGLTLEKHMALYERFGENLEVRE